MASKAEDMDTFLSHLESVLRYNENSNNTNGIPVYDPPIDDRQAAILRKLDALIVGKMDEAATNRTKAQAEEDRIRRNINHAANANAVRRLFFFRVFCRGFRL